MKWITPELHHVGVGAAQLLGGDGLAGHLLDHLRPGDEHLRLARLDDEIGERRAVGRAARARAADQRDLRHRAGEHHVGVEHLAVAGERVDAFLHAGAARIVDEYERRAGLERLLHDLGDLDGMDFARRAAGYREVLAGQMHQAAADRRRAGDHAIGRHALSLHAEQGGAVLGEQTDFFEAVRIHQGVDPLARGQLARLALLIELVGPAAEHQLFAPLAQFFHLGLHAHIWTWLSLA